MDSAVAAEPGLAQQTREPLYRPLDFVLIRAPLLPVEAYASLSEEGRQLDLLSDPHVHRALAVGSPSLASAIERFRNAALTRRDADRMRAKLLRYQIRMSTRPTPFGLFAGVAVSSWGAATSLVVRAPCRRVRTRPDMAWLMALVMAAEADSAIRKRLRFWANPLAIFEAGRVHLSERAPKGDGANMPPVSVRATGAAKQALAFARRPVPYESLVARLCETAPSATPEKVDKLLTELWEQTFLLTDLRPPLTTDDPARYVAERLAGIPEATGILARLTAFLEAASAWDRLEPEEGVKAFPGLLTQAGVPEDGSKEIPMQVDMAMAVEGQIGHSVAAEASRMAELLLRLSPAPQGPSSLAAYRQAFTSRYGHDREVPVLEMLSPSRGLGPPATHGQMSLDPAKAAQRAQTLLELACTALHERQRTVHLDAKTLALLETSHPDSKTAPPSVDINILVAARSAGAIDEGDFLVVLGPNLGALAAGRNLGRFADLVGPEGLAALEAAEAAEQAQAPDQLRAEVVFLPRGVRSANVVIRPAVRRYEIPFGVSPGVSPSSVIPLDQLVVGVDQGRFYVRWPVASKRVRFSSGHMLNLHSAPPVGRFLVELASDGRTVFSTFDWGPAEDFPYLPRVQMGRIVLRPAQWRIRKDELELEPSDAFRRTLDRWRQEWEVPRHVSLSFGDNRLILDLDQDSQAGELIAELQKLNRNDSIVMQEVVPALDETWLSGPGGHYTSEFVVSLVLNSFDEKAAAPAAVPRQEPAASGIEEDDGQLTRLHPPGSDWLFLKLYCPRNVEDDVLAESTLTLAGNATGSGLADSWFFVRYSDPDPHLRLRFHGSADRLTNLLLPSVCDWASRLMADGLCLKFMFDTYEQEIERFGGIAGMAAAEAIFSADSRGAAELLRCIRTNVWPHDRTMLAAVSIDELLGALGFDAAEKLRWYRSHAAHGGPDTGSDYRQRKNALRSLLGDPLFLGSQPGGDAIAAALQARRTALSAVGSGLRQLEAERKLGQPLETLCSSFVHLHGNRLGIDSGAEQRVLSLLLRARESLEKAPAGVSARGS
jgi:lantibiotic biosynthesis protein